MKNFKNGFKFILSSINPNIKIELTKIKKESLK